MKKKVKVKVVRYKGPSRDELTSRVYNQNLIIEKKTREITELQRQLSHLKSQSARAREAVRELVMIHLKDHG